MSTDAAQIAREAHALKAAGRLEDAIGLYRKAVLLAPKSGVAEHNLAGALGDAGQWAEAEICLRKAFAKGIDAPETWLVLARALQALNRFDGAEDAYRQAIRRRPALYDAHRELSQLRWMRSGDPNAAVSDLDKAIRSAPADSRLRALKAQALEFAGHPEAGLDLLEQAVAAHPQDAYIALTAAQAATGLGRTAKALAHAEHAYALAPQDIGVQLTLIGAWLAAGEAEPAARAAEALRQRYPDDLRILAILSTAWRLMGYERYRELYDYDAFVRAYTIDTPDGWTSLSAYLSDLGAGLKAAHPYRSHPFSQSLRQGSQAVDLLARNDKAIRALPSALDGPIRRHLDYLGQGGDPVRARNRGGYRMQGLWSVRLYSGGHHVDHVHPAGWLSSACYVETVQEQGREGWIKFGEPGTFTTPKLEAEHFVKPEPGMLVLFPSYMWHGTVPFGGNQSRLTVAFDLAPANAV